MLPTLLEYSDFAFQPKRFPRNKHVNQILVFADISRYSYEIPQKREMCTYLIVESVFIIGSQ